jgi:ketosteroid isomerase-like protein
MKSINRYNFILVAGILVIVSFLSRINYAAEKDEPENSNSTKDELIRTDKEFSEKSVKEGIPAAFIFYSADDVILMRDKHFPIVGKKELVNFYSKIKDQNAKLVWFPVKAEVSESGDLGYTFGNWIYYTTDSKDSSYGNYVTIWKKQKDGNWKFILDGGNSTPGPDTKK